MTGASATLGLGTGVAVVLVLAGCAQGNATRAARTPVRTPSNPASSAASATPTGGSPSAVRGTPPTNSPPNPARPTGTANPTAIFLSSVSAITPAIRARMPYSWRPGCPVGLADLRYLTLSYLGFDRAVHRGEMVVHTSQASAVVRALRSLFDAGIPIRQMRLVDAYHADDDASVAADNTSAYNCREVGGRPGVWSQHAYGVAIDVNPLENPYVHSDGSVDIPASRPFVDRSRRDTGMIHSSDATVDAFASIGWKWGGYWTSAKDYQHFSATGR